VSLVLKRRRRFAYSGQRHNGEQVTGTIEQQTQSLARAELWHQGITAERVEPASRQRWQRRITAKDCRELTRQFSVLLQAELPLLQALDVLHRSLKHPRWSPIVHQIRHDVSQGQSLAYAFAQHPAYFDALFCNLIAAGEQSGALAPLCARVVAHQARTERLQQQVRDALRYPLIVLGIAGVLSAIMITQVVPTFADLFLGFADELPTLTQALLALSQGLQSMGWPGLSLLLGSAVACQIGRAHV